MGKYARLIAALIILSGCLEQELDILTVDEASRLLSQADEKLWLTTTNDQELTLLFESGTTNNDFLLADTNGDTITYGTWSLTEDILGNFTDSLLLEQTQMNENNPLSDITLIDQLTSQLLRLSTDGTSLFFESE